MSFAQAMRWHADRDPDGVAIAHEDRHVTRAALEKSANHLARDFAERGVVPGSLVTVALPNGVAHFEACLAAWKLGATPQPVSSRLPKRELLQVIEIADPQLVVGVDPADVPERAAIPVGYSADAKFSDEPHADIVPKYSRALTSGGSTGRPKVILDLEPAQCDPEASINGMQPGGATLAPGPLYHAGPFITAWQQLLCGGTIVVMTRFEAAEALRLIQAYGVHWVLFVPTMMQRIWRLPEEVRGRYDLSSLRLIMCAGAPSPPWLKRAWIGWLGPERIFEAYGGTERISGTMISGSEWLEHPGSVGKPTEGRKLKILDAEGKECATGQVGEVYMMPAGGQGTTYRYIGAESTATSDGWETLGDLGYLDEEGYLYLVDRKTDMIVTGGANVYPAEVEAAIDAHPAIRSSAVIGLPDDDLGQTVHALVDATEPVSEAELAQHLEDQLVRYKIPRSFEFVEGPLRDDAGKVRRFALRQERLEAKGIS